LPKQPKRERELLKLCPRFRAGAPRRELVGGTPGGKEPVHGCDGGKGGASCLCASGCQIRGGARQSEVARSKTRRRLNVAEPPGRFECPDLRTASDDPAEKGRVASDEFVYLLRVLLRDPLIRARTLYGSDFYVVESARLEERRRAVRIRAVLGEEVFTTIAETNPVEFLGV
jgi:hypothetical protein